MYLHARLWGIQPSEFWAMTMSEWFAEYAMNNKSNDNYAGSLTQGDIDDIEDWLEELEEKGI